jgi:polyribonucleotide nucleotidyltransferase
MEGWQHDTQLLTWVLSYDGTTVPDPLAICGAAAALAISDIPLTKPVAAVELGMNPTTGAFIVNPTRVEQSVSPLHMTLAGTREGVLMIEGFSDFLTEAQMVAAVEVAHAAVARICVAIESWAKMVGKAKKLDGLKVVPKELRDALYEELGDKVFSMLRLTDPEVGGKDTSAGRAEMDALTSAALARFTEPYGATAVQVAFKKLCGTKMRELIRDTGRRCDGRAIDQVRPISIDHGLLPHTHGSALFTRGATQVAFTPNLGHRRMAHLSFPDPFLSSFSERRS